MKELCQGIRVQLQVLTDDVIFLGIFSVIPYRVKLRLVSLNVCEAAPDEDVTS